jgi:drug/metabolite transporter (DMT)-like permease
MISYQILCKFNVILSSINFRPVIYLFLSIFCSVLLLINFRFYAKFKINSFQSISFNYWVCFIVAYLLKPKNAKFELDFNQEHTLPFLALGIGFILTFIFSNISIQKTGLALTSLANNLSLIIPVLFSLIVFKTQAKVFSNLNYFGLGLAFVAIFLATLKNQKISQNQTTWPLLLVFCFYGLTNTLINYYNIKYLTDIQNTIPYTMIMLLGAILAGIVLLFYRYFKFGEKPEFRNIAAAMLLGIPNFLSFYFLIIALQSYKNDGAFVYPIYNIGVIAISALVAYIGFKENLSKANILGIILALIAIFLLSV